MGLPLTTSMTAFIYLLSTSMSMTGKLFFSFPFVHVSAFELEHDRNEFIKRPNGCLFHSYSLLKHFFISLYVLTALLYMVRLLCMFVYTYSHIYFSSTTSVEEKFMCAHPFQSHECVCLFYRPQTRFIIIKFHLHHVCFYVHVHNDDFTKYFS
jgi:hypothetical protein